MADTSPWALEVIILVAFCPGSRPFDLTEAVIYSLIITQKYQIFSNHRIKKMFYSLKLHFPHQDVADKRKQDPVDTWGTGATAL